MVAATLLTSTESPDTLLERIADDLVRVRPLVNGGLISTPVLFPSGSSVTVRITFDGDRCLITDDGAAYAEADMMGALPIFRRAARRVAEAAGIRFNDFEIFEIDASPDTAPGLIAIVADAARRSIEVTTERLADRLHSDTKASVFDLLVEAFGSGKVAADVSLSGASTHAWTVDALVASDRADIAVSVVNPVPASISSTYVKLDDIRRLDAPPRTVAALARRNAFKADQIAILNRTAKLIDLSATVTEFRRLAA
ncbi:hypothetical protein [Aurantimonas coralicida]|uniref:hypothetical protein n=1 Tax=Aurantimonas coralicida TaxID=182270 RepID=UPI001D185C23|nr:hypothetical protein [Aurantimonas coralicida]MCC4297949.1 hypothetical protein [Aurantimonas coralicida]